MAPSTFSSDASDDGYYKWRRSCVARCKDKSKQFKLVFCGPKTHPALKVGGALLVVLVALVVLALVALVAGVVLVGATIYGIYHLNKHVIAPFRAGTLTWNDLVSCEDGEIKIKFGRVLHQDKKPREDDDKCVKEDVYCEPKSANADIDALVEGLPPFLGKIAKAVFPYVGSDVQHATERAGELRRLTTAYLRANSAIVAEYGESVGSSWPQKWIDHTKKGVGKVKTLFPVTVESGRTVGLVKVKAEIDSRGHLELKGLKYLDERTGEKLDLLSNKSPKTMLGDAKKIE